MYKNVYPNIYIHFNR